MKIGLVLEGGANRGIFTSGVMDYLMEQGVTFQYAVGTSAGAGNVLNFLAGQKGRGSRAPTGLMLRAPTMAKGCTAALAIWAMSEKPP